MKEPKPSQKVKPAGGAAMSDSSQATLQAFQSILVQQLTEQREQLEKRLVEQKEEIRVMRLELNTAVAMLKHPNADPAESSCCTLF